MNTENQNLETRKSKNYLIKGFVILGISLILFLVSILIHQVISERKYGKQEAQNFITSHWGDAQIIGGAILRVPVYNTNSGKKVREFAYFYPENLSLNSEVFPEERNRGIYKIPIYKTEVSINSRFLVSNFPDRAYQFSEAEILIPISDLSKGLQNEANLNIDGKNYVMKNESIELNNLSREALITPFPISKEWLKLKHESSIRLKLQGSMQIIFLPNGIQNSIKIKGNWNNPSVCGNRLSEEKINAMKGVFNAQWNFVNQKLHQGNLNNFDIIEKESVGVDLFQPVDNYTKTERSVKYALLVILLTLTSFFLIENINKKELHFIHYALAGFALVVFYTLLLSFSEYIGFNLAYLISSALTIGLITWFIGSILKTKNISLVIGAILGAIYLFIFVLVTSEQYTLLMGSIGIFIILACVMYFTKKIKFS